MSAPSRTQRTRLKPPATESNTRGKETKLQQELPSSPPPERERTPPLDQEEAQNILLALSNGASAQTVAETSGPVEEQIESNSSVPVGLAHAQTSTALSDSGSSSLSELEGTLEDEDALSGDSDVGSDDAMSDRQSEHHSEQDDDDDNGGEDEDEDTEAETERLDNSPEKRRRDAQLLQSVALRNDETMDDESVLENDDAGDVGESEELPSIAPLGADTTIAKSLPEEEMAGRKRKRTSSSSRAVPGLETEPARKKSAAARHMSRTLSVKGDLGELSQVLEDADVQDAEEEALSDQSDEEKVAEENEETAAEGRESKAKAAEVGDDAESSGGELSEPPEEQEPRAEAEQEEDEEEGEQAAAEGEEDEDEDEGADAAAKSEDEMARKMAAMEALKPIEKLFAVFRDKLFDERLEMLSSELQLLNQPDPDHSTFVAMRRALDVRRDEKIAMEQMLMQYKLEVLERTTVASQAQLHSQFYQGVRQMRETHMTTLNEHFSKIQRDRRQIRSNEPVYGIKFNSKRSLQIGHQRSYNKEVSLLSGIARHVGFPAAPDIKAPTQAEVDDDLRAMKIRVPQPAFIPAAGGSSSRTRQDEGVTEEAWIEKNAWANPNHPVNQQARLMDRQALGNSSPYATPALQRRLPDSRHVPGSGSTLEIASEQQSSALGPSSNRAQPGGLAFEEASPFEQMKRRNLEPQRSDGTPRAQRAELANGIKQAVDGSPSVSQDVGAAATAAQQANRTPSLQHDHRPRLSAPRPEPMTFSPPQAERGHPMGYAGPASSPPAPPAPSAPGLGVR